MTLRQRTRPLAGQRTRSQGSWWPAWHEWPRYPSGTPVKPPRVGLLHERPLGDTPGRYVLEK